ncbi:MAG: phosphatase PAP2 family protein [Acidobacteria bacterium]|nr:phosphatase PAP2 family protein [Acidobacteriota bacterium]
MDSDRQMSRPVADGLPHRGRSFFGVRLLCVLLFLAVLCFAGVGAFAQGMPQQSPTPAAQPSPTPTLERQFFKNILRDQRAIWTSPFRLRAGDARWLVPLGAATTALIATDRRTAGTLHDDRTRLAISRHVSRSGALYTSAGVASAFYVAGRRLNDVRMRETGLLGLEALADVVVVHSTLKAITQRPRPRADGGRGRFFTGGNSFPSGHSMQAWTLAAVVASEYHKRPLMVFTSYGLATAVSMSRFTGRKHFLSDVLAGSAIGYGIGRYVYHAHHNTNLDAGDSGVGREHSRLFPSISPRYNPSARLYGVTLAWGL